MCAPVFVNSDHPYYNPNINSVAAPGFQDNKWMHVVVVVTGAAVNLFVNGALGAAGSLATFPVSTVARTSNYIGRFQDPTSASLNGTVAYVTVWQGYALQASDVGLLYSASQECPAGSLATPSPGPLSCTCCAAGTGGATCTACPSGAFTVTDSTKECSLCAPGTYQPASGSVGCLKCAQDKYSGSGYQTCVTSPSHGWNFRGCSSNAPVLDAYGGSLVATAHAGATCGHNGIAFDGSSGYVTIPSWEWGGAVSVEAFAMYHSLSANSRIFVFSAPGGSDMIALGTFSVRSAFWFRGNLHVMGQFFASLDVASLWRSRVCW